MPLRSLGCLTLLSIATPLGADSIDFAPVYQADGNLTLPMGFEKWIFVGSNLGLSYENHLVDMTPLEARRATEALFHNVYLDPNSYRTYVETGEFPNPSTLVMEIFAAAEREPKGVLSEGHYNGDFRGLQVAVKNAQRPGIPPDGSEWAYYVFSDGSAVLPSAAAFPDSACAACHKAHASKDNVWVQFYPTLREPPPPSRRSMQ